MTLARLVSAVVVGVVLHSNAWPAEAQTVQLMMATGSVGGAYYPLGAAMSKIANDKVRSINMSVRTTGGSVENARLLHKKEVELALLTAQAADQAYRGKPPFTEPVSNLRAIGTIFPDVILFVARADRGIKRFEDLKGKKVNVGAVGSATEFSSRQMLRLFGLEYPRDLTPIHLPFAQAGEQLRDGHVDAINFFVGVPNSTLIDITTMQKVVFLEFKGEPRERLLKAEPVIYAFTLPPNTYKGQETPVESIAMPSALFVDESVSADLVYQITKAVYDNKDDVARTHVLGRWIEVKDAAKGITMPFHPGAERYLREKGVLK